ncbi:MAG: hypothetical protein ACFBSD_01365 [Paracoccaceae bacterium]
MSPAAFAAFLRAEAAHLKAAHAGDRARTVEDLAAAVAALPGKNVATALRARTPAAPTRPAADTRLLSAHLATLAEVLTAAGLKTGAVPDLRAATEALGGAGGPLADVLAAWGAKVKPAPRATRKTAAPRAGDADRSAAVAEYAARIGAAEPAEAIALIEAAGKDKRLRLAELRLLFARLFPKDRALGTKKSDLLRALSRPYHEAIASAGKASALKSRGTL